MIGLLFRPMPQFKKKKKKKNFDARNVSISLVTMIFPEIFLLYVPVFEKTGMHLSPNEKFSRIGESSRKISLHRIAVREGSGMNWIRAGDTGDTIRWFCCSEEP